VIGNERSIFWITQLLVAFFFLAMICRAEKLSVESHPDFAEGQEWSIKGVPQSTAKVIIGRIESWKDKIAVHVSIVDIPDSQEVGRLHISEIAHVPFEKSALAASVEKLIATGVLPAGNFDAGYKQWKENKGGIYTVPIAQAIGLAPTSPSR